MDEYQLAMIVYFSLQAASLILLPKWWKLPALPALWMVWRIVEERVQPGYMSDVFIVMLAIYTCAYLILVWLVFGVVKLVRRRTPTECARHDVVAREEGDQPQ